MLGIMNCGNDSVEIYAPRDESKIRKQESLEQTRAFTEIKRKPTITYGGQRLIDGKLVTEVDGVQLWHAVIRKKSFEPRTGHSIIAEDVIRPEDENEETETHYVLSEVDGTQLWQEVIRKKVIEVRHPSIVAHIRQKIVKQESESSADTEFSSSTSESLPYVTKVFVNE